MPSASRTFQSSVVRSLVAVGALLAPCWAQRPTYVAVLGDGTAAPGPGLDAPWPERFHPFKQVELPVISNLAAAGRTSASGVADLAAHDAEETVDQVVIQYGFEDALVDVEHGATEPRVGRAEYAANLRALVTSIRERNEHTRIVLVTPSPLRWTDALRAKYARPPYDPEDLLGLDHLVATYATEVRALAASLGLPLVDVHRVFSRRDRFAGHSTADWLADGVHPNAAGHQVIQHLVARALVCPEPFVPGAPIHARPAWVDPSRWQGRPDYSLPVLDLSRDRHRQVVVDREAGQYLGHPTTVLLEDGRTMLAVYPQGHGKGAIVMKRSSDAGLTWSERLPTPASWATSREVPTIHRVVDAAGTRRLVLFSGLYPIRMAHSADNGSNWSELEPIGAFGGIVAMGAVVETRTPGRYLAFFHDDGRFIAGSGQRAGPPHWTWFNVYQAESTDGGLSWSSPHTIAGIEWHHCEPGCVRSPDGSTLALLLRENSRYGNSHVIFSTDEGATWSVPRPLPGALTGDRHIARYAPDGRLFVTFRDTTLVSPTWGDWVAWVGTWDDLVEGREGQYRVRLLDNTSAADCAYPGLELLPDGTFVTTTYGHWTRGERPYIVSVRLRLEELDQLAADPRELR